MAHFTRIRGSGLWVPGSTILQSELEQLDDNQAAAINGDGGGTWAPSSLITIGGLGLTASGPFSASNAQSFTLNGTMTGAVGSFVNLSGTQTITGTTALSGTLNCNASATIAGSTTITGPTTISGNVAMSGTTSSSGTTTLSGPLTISGATTQTAQHTKSGANAYTSFRTTQISSALTVATLSTDADIWWVLTPIAVNTTYTLKSTSPVPPDGTLVTVLCYNVGLGKTVEMQREDTSLVLTFTTGNGGAEFVVIGSDWKLKNVWGDYTLGSVFA